MEHGKKRLRKKQGGVRGHRNASEITKDLIKEELDNSKPWYEDTIPWGLIATYLRLGK